MSIHVHDIVALRKAARLSQSDLASYLNLSQSQISRYEDKPESISMEHYIKWIEVCGLMSSARPLEVGSPREAIDHRVKMMSDYLRHADDAQAILKNTPYEESGNLISLQALRYQLIMAARKPRLAIAGAYDAGKTRLLNNLMGCDHLPTGYQPATSLITHVRHIDDKPDWHTENVWIMDANYDIQEPDNEENACKNRLIGGGYEALRSFAVHTEKELEFPTATYAVVYMDSDFLRACDLIDLPGYGHGSTDDSRAEMAHQLADILIYASPSVGFMNQADRQRLGQALRYLPTLEAGNNIKPLSNLFVVATRAHDIRGQEENIFETAADHCYEGMQFHLERRAKSANFTKSSVNDLKQRMFTYSIDDRSLCRNFEGELKDLLCTKLPERTQLTLSLIIEHSRTSSLKLCNDIIDGLEQLDAEQTSAKNDLEAIRLGEIERRADREAKRTTLRNLINELEEECDISIREIFQRYREPAYLAEILERRYDSAKEAKEVGIDYLFGSLQDEIETVVQSATERLHPYIDELMDSYAMDGRLGEGFSANIGFDARRAFISSLAGAGTFGGLAGWASATAAGSNLGGYVLVGKVVAWLKSLGINVGGTRVVFEFIKKMGGPAILAASLSLLVAIAAYILTGEKWPMRFGKKIADYIKKSDIEETVVQQLKKFWLDTIESFTDASEQTEIAYEEHLKKLEESANNGNYQSFKSKIDALLDVQNHWLRIPSFKA